MKLSKKSSSVLLTGYFVFRTDKGPVAPAILNYLLDKALTVVYIEHPFPHSQHPYSYLSVYRKNNLQRQLRIRRLEVPSIFQYLINFFLTQIFLIITHSRYDLSISCENLSFFYISFYKRLGLIKRDVYYSVDYTNTRFANPLLNKIYHLVDKFCLNNSTINWVVTKEQINSRVANYSLMKNLPFEIVPIGYDIRDVPKVDSRLIDRFQLIYTGGLIKSSGPQLIIEALPELLKMSSKFKLVIVGGGAYESELKKLVQKLRLQRYVEFKGFVPSNIEVYQTLVRSGIGLAPFIPEQNSVSMVSDPSKIKLYLICGLPIVTTHATTIAKQISFNKVGEVIDYRKEELVKAVLKITKNPRIYQQYRKHASLISKRYDLNRILNQAISNIP